MFWRKRIKIWDYGGSNFLFEMWAITVARELGIFIQIGCKTRVQLSNGVCFRNQMHVLILLPDSSLFLQFPISAVDAGRYTNHSLLVIVSFFFAMLQYLFST